MAQKMNIGIVGGTGLVGRNILYILLERNFPINSIKLFATSTSAGKKIYVFEKCFVIEELKTNSFKNLDIVFFAAGSDVSSQYTHIAVNEGCTVIDNSSYWRLHKDVPLVIPEVNNEVLFFHNKIIANPNCSTILLVMVLSILSKINEIERVVVSTYQAVSGGGQKWIDKLYSEKNGILNDDQYKIFNSIMFHSSFNSVGNTIEEEKMINETRKILNIPDFKISPTCVRLPIENSHCESVNVEFKNNFNLNNIKKSLSSGTGISFFEDLDGNKYPTPLHSNGKDNILVGRVRNDLSKENSINLWIVGDNVRKGAATNAIQIAETLIAKNLIKK